MLHIPLQALKRVPTHLQALKRVPTPLQALKRVPTPLQALKRVPTPLQALKGNNSCKTYNFRLKVGNVKMGILNNY